MPSTFSPALRLELIGNGEQAANWGNTTNTNLGTLLEQAITGVASVAFPSDANYILVSGNGIPDQSRNAVLVMTGAINSTRSLIVPSTNKFYAIRNATVGGQNILVRTAAGTGVTLANGFTQLMYCDGTNVVMASVPINSTTGNVSVEGSISSVGGFVGNLTGNATTATGLSGIVAIANGGTGATTAGTARTALGSTATGDSIFTAINAGAARTALGSTVTGDSLFTAATAGAARTALGSTVTGDSLFTAATAGTARTALGSTVTGDSLFTAIDAAAARTTIGAISAGVITSSGLTMSANRVLGRASSGTGAVEELSSVPVSLGGTGSTTASGARTNLGLAIGTNIPSLAGNTFTASQVFGGTIDSFGYRSRSGTGGPYQQNHYNIQWSSPNATLFIDATSIAVIATSSDRRIKDHIEPIASATAQVMALNPVTYRWRNEGIFQDDGVTRWGFIADEVQAVIPSAVVGAPDAVTSDGAVQPQNVVDRPIIAALTKALQESITQIEALKARVAALEAL